MDAVGWSTPSRPQPDLGQQLEPRRAAGICRIAKYFEAGHLLYSSGHYEYAFVAIDESATGMARVASFAGTRVRGTPIALEASLTGRVLRRGAVLASSAWEISRES